MIFFHSVYSEHRIEKMIQDLKDEGQSPFYGSSFWSQTSSGHIWCYIQRKERNLFPSVMSGVWKKFLQKSTLFNDHQRCPFLYVCFMWKCFSIVSENLVECVFQCKEHDHSREQGLLTVPLITGEIQQGGVGGRGTKKSRKKLLDWYNNTKHEMWYPEPFYHIGTSYQKLKFQ